MNMVMKAVMGSVALAAGASGAQAGEWVVVGGTSCVPVRACAPVVVCPPRPVCVTPSVVVCPPRVEHRPVYYHRCARPMVRRCEPVLRPVGGVTVVFSTRF